MNKCDLRERRNNANNEKNCIGRERELIKKTTGEKEKKKKRANARRKDCKDEWWNKVREEWTNERKEKDDEKERGGEREDSRSLSSSSHLLLFLIDLLPTTRSRKRSRTNEVEKKRTKLVADLTLAGEFVFFVFCLLCKYLFNSANLQSLTSVGWSFGSRFPVPRVVAKTYLHTHTQSCVLVGFGP